MNKVKPNLAEGIHKLEIKTVRTTEDNKIQIVHQDLEGQFKPVYFTFSKEDQQLIRYAERLAHGPYDDLLGFLESHVGRVIIANVKLGNNPRFMNLQAKSVLLIDDHDWKTSASAISAKPAVGPIFNSKSSVSDWKTSAPTQRVRRKRS